ncbi:hypothetical protein XBKQ1_1380005 [Xenorhabdus bovienii str. kraussei Quebec]|uniref:Tc1-like transposase DDE domain-containing protein n=1 Tax=Xenorhabdus bovienii str. kraussei Quebec TaxID=1398203 RepID=A0A077PD95_XENBV|nr:hypothetical protein XBKQ1_1380005 [Xenorhabdus bovienii str. kraussei Quebec]
MNPYPTCQNNILCFTKMKSILTLIDAQTGQVTYVSGIKKNSDLFIKMLKELSGQYRHAKNITLILDNYGIHKSQKVRAWLKQNPKCNLLFLPIYSP